MNRVKLSVDNLNSGEYVAALDRPWSDTPFFIEGFFISNDRQIEQLKQCCRHVYIDPSKRTGESQKDIWTSDKNTALAIDSQVPPLSSDTAGYHLMTEGVEAPLDSYYDFPHAGQHPSSSAIEDELITAGNCYKNLGRELGLLVGCVVKSEHYDFSRLITTIGQMVDSCLRNSDALLWHTKHKTPSNYMFGHCMDVAALLAYVGCYLGYEKGTLIHMAMGGLLMDIGKIRMDKVLHIKSSPLSSEEKSSAREHVENTREILASQDFEFHPIVRDIAFNHHERFDGSGYPVGKHGQSNSAMVYFAGIADAYDSMCSTRLYQPNIMAPSEVIHSMYAWRDTQFPAELVDLFIQCVGYYPTSSLVKLNSGAIAAVVAQNPRAKLKPKIVVVKNSVGGNEELPRVVDLSDAVLDLRVADADFTPADEGLSYADLYITSEKMEQLLLAPQH